MPPHRAVLGVENASYFYGARRVFEHVSFQLDDARTALVGENGAGKSTLLKCLLGELDPVDGQIVRSRGLKIGYVPQDIPQNFADLAVREVLEGALPVRDGSDDWKVDVLIDDIGLPQDAGQQRFGALSGGWRRLLLIAAAAQLGDPDLLILDEPTNHLDLANINRLERWLAESDLPMLIVRHDRAFLQKTTSRTLFLRSDGAHAFRTPFVEAREALLQRDAADAHRRQLEGKEIDRLRAVAARYRVWGVKNDAFHKRAKATEKRIERIETGRTAAYAARERRLELHDGEMDAKVALRVQGLAVDTPDGARRLLTVDRFALGLGDRVALLGVNGSGKSTLLAALAAAFDPTMRHYDGAAAVRFNPQARLAYFDQTMADLPLADSLLDYLLSSESGDRDANAVLARAGFAHARIRGPIGDLSHGERARLVFLRMKLAKPNLYLLDEPTNHLDIEGQEDLEIQLDSPDSACIFVSHDRYFTRATATRFLEIRRGRLMEVDDADAFFDAQ